MDILKQITTVDLDEAEEIEVVAGKVNGNKYVRMDVYFVGNLMTIGMTPNTAKAIAKLLKEGAKKV